MIKKEFFEYCNKGDGTYPYSMLSVCYVLVEYAKDYVKVKRDKVLDIDTKVRDAVLVDMINSLEVKGCLGFCVHIDDLYSNIRTWKRVHPIYLLTVLLEKGANYIYNNGDYVMSVIDNRHITECEEYFKWEDGVRIILDFINYISSINGYARVFENKDLYEKASTLSYKKKMRELGEFLELVNVYMKKLEDGENILGILQKKMGEYELEYVTDDGEYYYTNEAQDKYGIKTMFTLDKERFDNEVYAMLYAYCKKNNCTKLDSDNVIVKTKMKELLKDK